MALYLLCIGFNWQVIQVTFRLEDVASSQSRATGLEREKMLDAARTLKVSKADLSKVREQLVEMKKAQDIAESGLASAQKQAHDQTERLL